jgi:hypothetical protein
VKKKLKGKENMTEDGGKIWKQSLEVHSPAQMEMK